jgi:endonuclease/exonuclease/phosphatase family metal-dependent hydrolase
MAKKNRYRFLQLLLKSCSVISALALLIAYLAPFIHPNTLGFIPFFGLGYPIIISIFFVFMVLQAFLNKWWAAIMFVIFIAGFNLHSRVFSLGSGDSPERSETTLKVMSYNVHLFDRHNSNPADADQTRRKILRYLKHEAPDVICFQEFYHQDDPTGFSTKDTLLDILDIRDYQERYTLKSSGHQYYGIALFSKYPIVEKGEVHFSSASNTSNFAIYSDIAVKEDTIRFYNLHLQSIRLSSKEKAALSNETSDEGLKTALSKIMQAFPERADQANRLIQHIGNSRYPVVVCGDFNDTPLSYSYQRFSNILTDAFTNSSKGIGKTYAGKIPAGRIDYIFHSATLGSFDFNIQKEALSDHYAIGCNIFVKSK